MSPISQTYETLIHMYMFTDPIGTSDSFTRDFYLAKSFASKSISLASDLLNGSAPVDQTGLLVSTDTAVERQL